MSGSVNPGTEIQVYDTSDQQASGHFWNYLWVAALVVSLVYSFLCFALGFKTKGFVSPLRSIPEMLSPKKVPRL